jgi:hypothetical protein
LWGSTILATTSVYPVKTSAQCHGLVSGSPSGAFSCLLSTSRPDGLRAVHRADFPLEAELLEIRFHTGPSGRLICAGLEYHIEHHFFPEIGHVYYPQGREGVAEVLRGEWVSIPDLRLASSGVEVRRDFCDAETAGRRKCFGTGRVGRLIKVRDAGSRHDRAGRVTREEHTDMPRNL